MALNSLQLARNLDTLIQDFALTSAANFDLPSTGIRAGQAVLVYNNTANNSLLTVRSSALNTVETIRFGYCLLIALQNAPTADTHWKVVDVYEEGSWIPTVIMGTSQGTASISVSHALYSRKMNCVTVNARFTLSKGTGTGTVIWGSLPYTVSASTTRQNAGILIAGNSGDLALTAGNIGIQFFLGGTTTVDLYQMDADTGASTQLTDANFDGGALVYLAGSYHKS